MGPYSEVLSGSILFNACPVCLFAQVDNNPDNVVTRERVKRALADRELILRDDQLAQLMTFFDVHRRGYVTLGDFHDSLKRFRASEQQRVQVSEQTMASTCPQTLIRQQPNSLPDSSAETRLQSALLAPLVLFTTPVPVEGLGKRQRSMTKAAEKRILEQEAGVSYLDITDPEINSLVDYLMGVGNCDDGENCGRGTGGHPSKPTDSLSADADQSQLRPLSLVMSALESAAARSPNSSSHPNNRGNNQSVRGPGAAAVPSSAERVLRILRSLQKVWHRTDRRRAEKELAQLPPDELFSDEKMSAAIGLFDVDGKGHIQLEDVMTVFRNVRVGRSIRRQPPPTAAISSLGALGRYLENRSITAHDFIQEAALSAVTIVDTEECCGQSKGAKSTRKGKKAGNTRNRAQPATTAQLGELLCSGVHLNAQQTKFILECVEDGGFVSGANLAWAVERAKGELAHRKLARLERKRDMAGGRGRCESRESESQVSEPTVTGSGSGYDITLPPRVRQQPKGAAGEKAGINVPLPHKHQCRRGALQQQDVFNQRDASLVLEFFVKEGGGLRFLTGETAVALWRCFKRRGRDLHAYQAGRLASRRLRRLLRARGLKPAQWFATLHTAANSPTTAAAAGCAAVACRVPTSSIIHGVNDLVDMAAVSNPLGEANAAAVAVATTVVGDDDSSTTSVERSLSDGTIDPQPGNVAERDKWTKAELSALACHLDPCGEGSVTQVALLEGLSDCRTSRAVYPDAVQIAAARRFEAALQDLGCRDICGLLQTLAGRGPGGGDLVEYVQQIGDCSARGASHELDNTARHEQAGQTIAIRELVSANALQYEVNQ